MEDENLSRINKEKNNDSIKKSEENGQDEQQTSCLFCVDCLQIPVYEIDLRKGVIYLLHTCKGNKKEILFQSEIKGRIHQIYPCIYCNKKCKSICIECSKSICADCKEKHLPDEPDESNEIPQMIYIKEKEKEKKRYKQYIMPYDDIQFICKTHFIKYEYFCPICKINLCEHCKNYHFHINCSDLSKYDISVNYKQYSCSDSIVSNLTKLCKLFEDCYKDATKKEKLSINIIMNYSIIEKINNFITKYEKTKNMTDKITNTLFNKEKESHYMCRYFYNKEFKTEYSELINAVNNGNYEYYFKMKDLKLFYKKMNRISLKYDWDNFSFFSSLKGKIDFFRSQYHYMKEIISEINNNLNINYIKKENENIKLLFKVFEIDLNLIKKINMSLLYKIDLQLRRKVGNLFAELLIVNNSNLLDEIEETDYIIMETLIILKKKISQIKNLDVPNDQKEKYERELTAHYKSILKKASPKVQKELDNVKKENQNMKIIEANEEKIQFHQLNNNSNSINDAVLINLFFRLKSNFLNIFNQSIHNKTEEINTQIEDELEKFKKNLFDSQIENKNSQSKDSSPNINVEENKLCDSYFKEINNLKLKMNIQKDITLSKNENILKLFKPIKKDRFIEADFNHCKSELEKLFKNYDFEESINIKNALEIIFHGNILNLLMEKNIYQNYQSLKNEMKSHDLEVAKKDFLKDLANIEPTLDKYLEKIESIKNKAHKYFKQIENSINLDKIKIDIIEKNNPFLFLEKFTDITLFDITSQVAIENAYFSYLINFYFCAQDASNYLREIKNNYKEAKLLIEFANSFEKLQLLEIFDSKLKSEEHDELKERWDKLKQEKDFVKGNEILNQKIKEYVEKNDECQYLKDLSNMNQLKDLKINLSSPDPKHLIVRVYWLQKGIPWTIPLELKNTEMKK